MARQAWSLARTQHWAITFEQLRDIGFSRTAIQHRKDAGRLFPQHRGVFSVGRPELSRLGKWKAAELAIGGKAGLMLDHAAALWGMAPGFPACEIALAVPLDADPDIPDLDPRRRCARVMREMQTRWGIRVLSPVCTLVDISTRWSQDQLEAAISEADKRDIVRADALRVELERLSGIPGVAKLRKTLDRHTFRLSDSRLERLFRPIAKRAGLGVPDTQKHLGTGRVDFVFPDLGLVVETDGLRYHRTAAQQGVDLKRDNEHGAVGRERLRFSHAQIRYESAYVEDTLRRTARRLRS